MYTDIDKQLRRAHNLGVRDRELNPAEYDENADNYFIFIAFDEGQTHRKYAAQDGDFCLVEAAKEGREERRHFLLN